MSIYERTWNQVKFSVRVRAIRHRAYLTQEALAERANISRNTITKMESCGDVKLSTLIAVSDALLMPVYAWFLPEEEWTKWYDNKQVQP